jgi:hypothetical protein
LHLRNIAPLFNGENATDDLIRLILHAMILHNL